MTCSPTATPTTSGDSGKPAARQESAQGAVQHRQNDQARRDHGVLTPALLVPGGWHPGARGAGDRRRGNSVGADARRHHRHLRSSIQRGTSFVDAVNAHAEVFPAFYRAMLASAEYTGNLDEVLSQLAAYLERDIAARRQVKSALTYPTVVLFVATIGMFVMSVFVLPKFTGLYASLGAHFRCRRGC